MPKKRFSQASGFVVSMEEVVLSDISLNLSYSNGWKREMDINIVNDNSIIANFWDGGTGKRLTFKRVDK